MNELTAKARAIYELNGFFLGAYKLGFRKIREKGFFY